MFSSNTTQVSDGGYQISRSLRFNSADTAYLARTPSTASNRRTYTWSGWVKRSQLSVYQRILEAGSSTADRTVIGFDNSDKLEFFNTVGGTVSILTTTQVLRDASAWYHIVVAMDTTQATASNRTRCYLNGVEITSFATANYVTQNADTYVNSAIIHRIGANQANGDLLNGYMTEVNFIDGTQLTPSSFGETNAQTGVWQPKAYSGSYGTNGFYLNFSDNSNTTAATLGKDYSGNGNNWTPNNFSVTAGAGNDSLVDSPTSYGTDTGVGGTVRGNYCTWNSVLQTNDAANTYTNGNLEVSSSGSNWANGTISTNTGSYYFELTPTVGASSSLYLGLNNTKTDVRIAAYSGGIEASPGGGSNQGSLASWSNGDIIGVAVNGVSKTVQFYRNGSTYGTLVTYTTALDLFPFVRNGAISSSTVVINAGQRPFAYTAPSGFKALCTQNLPTPTIGATTDTQAGKFFNPVLYTGNGTGQSITGVGFQPDWVWIKGRSGATDHALYDAVRGVQKQIETNQSGAETTETTGLTAFGSDGFTTGLLPQLNTITATYVAWNWKANGSGSTNTAGSITSTVSANTTSGFSIVTYTGTGANATVGHGLGAVPTLIIGRSRSTAGGWPVYSATFSNPRDNYLELQNTNSVGTASNYWGTSGPTSTTFSLSTYGGNNDLNGTFVMYCFTPIAGFSSIGSYTGNGSTDGPFIYTGMRPAYVMIKNTTLASAWIVYDNKRNTANVETNYLLPNSSGAEATLSSLVLDFTSNGFKIRGDQATINTSNNNYIYMAFAEVPLKFSLAR